MSIKNVEPGTLKAAFKTAVEFTAADEVNSGRKIGDRAAF
jgi:hypothetical protein